MSVVYVALGGAMGAVMRFAVSNVVLRTMGAAFPWGTLAVNMLGSFIAGLLWSILGQTVGQQRLNALFVIGMMGAFTTFSTFSLESFRLYEEAGLPPALLNVAANNIGALLAVIGGIYLGRTLLTP
ncbi:MAG: fluoride efflux transporter CrcB [Bacteroidetes bacterium CG12_big_fil_rev_8_21_14_0_65_60_17]|nr:MAG: fluoride efflux transporter CrcB [Bacteroidetes bacterium CG12_big_fil_rev_8_21_14_0_65_60_17]